MKWIFIDGRYVNLDQVTQIIIDPPNAPEKKWTVEFRLVNGDMFYVKMEKDRLYLLKIFLNRELDVTTIPLEEEEL